jgi:hypothetical protein
LHREDPASREAAEERRDERRVIVEPVEGGVAQEERWGRRGRKAREIAEDEASLREERARLGEHIGRAVHAKDLAAREALREQARDIAGAAAEINDITGHGEADPPD